MSQPIRKFEMNEAWNNTVTLLRTRPIDILALAGVFLFLPQFLLIEFSGIDDTLAQVSASFSLSLTDGSTTSSSESNTAEGFAQAAPFIILSIVATVVGWLSILALWLGKDKVTIGEASISGLKLSIVGIVCMIITLIAMGVGLLLLIIPGLYLYARFAPIYVCVVAEDKSNPIEIIKSCWQLTAGNGWRIFLFLFLVILAVSIVVGILVGGLALVTGDTTIVNVISALLDSLVTVLTVAMSASIYQQLSGHGVDAVFE